MEQNKWIVKPQTFVPKELAQLNLSKKVHFYRPTHPLIQSKTFGQENFQINMKHRARPTHETENVHFSLTYLGHAQLKTFVSVRMSSLIVTDYSTVESAITVTSPIKSPVDIRDSCCYRQKTGTSVKLLVGRVLHAREQFSLCPCSPLIFEQPRFLCNQQ